VSTGNALKAVWSFDASFQANVINGTYTAQFLYLLVTDYGAIGSGDTISSVVVVPLTDGSGNLNTSYTITSQTPGMIPIVNGTEYHLMSQMVYAIGSNIVSENSAQSIVMCSTIPEVPNFLLAPITDAFIIQLLDSNGQIPTPVSAFDGYSVLKGIFITYASTTQLYSKFIANDASNSLYNTPQQIDVSLNSYEVSISSYNYNSVLAPNNTTVTYGGRSATSASQTVEVDDTPGIVPGLTVYETMRDVSASVQPSYTFVSNTLTWNTPIIGASAESITNYNIYRKIAASPDASYALIGVVTKPSTNFTNRTYVDANNSITNPLTAGVTYRYQVAAENANGEGPRGLGQTMTAVVFPTQTAFAADPSGNAAIQMIVTNVSPNGFPSSALSYDYSYNGTAGPQGFISSNPYLATDVSNGVTYLCSAATRAESQTQAGTYYTTSYWTPADSVVPYNPDLANATDASLNPLTVLLSGQPSGQVIVSWTNPAQPFANGQMTYQIFRKLNGAVDASYVALNSYTNVTQNSRTSYTDSTGVLGTAYQYKIVNRFVGSGAFAGQVATSSGLVTNQITPFLAPSAVQNLQLLQSTATTTDISYSFVAPDSSGGYAIAGYNYTVLLLSDGSSVTLTSGTTQATSGLLSSLLGSTLNAGNQYGLTISAFVNGNTGAYTGSASPDGTPVLATYAGPSSTSTAYTVPVGINSPPVVNAQNGQLLNGLLINWAGTQQYLDMDASNASFRITKGISVVATVTGSSYLDPSAAVGISTQYQVRSSVGGIDSSFVLNQIPTPTAPATRLALPSNVTGLAASNITLDSLTASWNAVSATSTGTSQANMRYYWVATNTATGLVDASGITSDISANITGLSSGSVYEIMVCSGLLNPSDSQNYFNTVGCPTITQALYSSIPQAELKQIYPSYYVVGTSGALLADVVDATDVSGLTFFGYNLQVATDASFTNIISDTISNASEFYISGLTNGVTYYVRAINKYLNAVGQTVNSPVSDTETGVPTTAPNRPDGLIATTANTPLAVTLYWNVPTSGIQPNLYSVTISDNSNNLINDPSFVSVNSYNTVNLDGVLKYVAYKDTFNGQPLQFGIVYYMQVIAANQISGGFTVSQPSEIVEVVPYTSPSAVRNLTSIPSQTSITSSWIIPDPAGGAGVGNNGIMLYRATLSLDPSFNTTPVIDVSGIQTTSYQFTDLLENTTYNVRIIPYFYIQNDPNYLSVGDPAYNLFVDTQTPPQAPVLQATANNDLGAIPNIPNQQRQRTCILTWNPDKAFASTTTIKRKVMNPAGTVTLNDYIPIGSVSYAVGQPPGLLPGIFIDSSANPDPSGNFLDGNRVFYQIDISYDIINGSDVIYTGIDANVALPPDYRFVIPYDQPIPTDLSGNFVDITDASALSQILYPLDLDASGNFKKATVKINKNGAGLTSLIFVSIASDGADAPVVEVANPDSTIVWNNPQVSFDQTDSNPLGIAQNQYGSYTVDFGDTYVNGVLVVETNQGGALVLKYPEDGIFGPNVQPYVPY
jgi:hypothetical protein